VQCINGIGPIDKLQIIGIVALAASVCVLLFNSRQSYRFAPLAPP